MDKYHWRDVSPWYFANFPPEATTAPIPEFHPDAEEMFLVFKGRFRVEFRDQVVELTPGQMLVVPRGVEHRTASDDEAEVMIFEPSEVVNTGDAEASEFTAPMGVRV